MVSPFSLIYVTEEYHCSVECCLMYVSIVKLNDF